MRIVILAYLFCALSCATPKPATDAASSPAQSCPCPKDIFCTEDFRMVTLRLTRAGAPLRLDRWETATPTGRVLRRADSSVIQPGLYAVATDAERAQISSCGERFVFRGWIGKKKVVEAQFLLKDDCCHVQRIEGPEELVVN